MKKLLENILFWIGWAIVMSAFQVSAVIGLISVLVVSAFYVMRRGDKDEAMKYYQGMNALFLGEITAIVIYLVTYCVKLL